MATPRTVLKRILPRTLLGRSLLIIVTPLILLQVISTFVFYDRHWDTVARRLAGAVAGDIATVIRLLNERPDPDGQAGVLEIAKVHMNLRATLKPGAILRNTARQTERGVLERTLISALQERVRKPFQIDTRSYDRDIEISVQLPGRGPASVHIAQAPVYVHHLHLRDLDGRHLAYPVRGGDALHA